jgi:hypothetical protein
MNGDTAGIVAPVFKPLQALKQDGNNVALADCTDDATHDENSKD